MLETRALMLDTNVYLHAQPFQQIPWATLLKCDNVLLVVPRVAIRELDDKKTTGRTKRVRERARKTADQILSIFESGGFVSPGIQLVEFFERPVGFDELGLQPEFPDHQLLASLHLYRVKHPDHDAALVTFDVGPRLEARRLGIPLLALPKEYVLAPELDETEKELRDLRVELARLTTAQPRLSLSFVGGDNQLSVTRSVAPPLEETLRLTLEEKRESLEKHDRGSMLAGIMSIAQPTQSEVQRFRTQIPEYLKRYEEWLRTELERQLKITSMFKIPLEIRNEGTAPAQGVRVILTIPSGIEVNTERLIPAPTREPLPPTSPRSAIELQAEELRATLPRFAPIPLPERNTPFASLAALAETRGRGPTITTSHNGLEVEFMIGKVQQGGRAIPLEPLYLTATTVNSIQIKAIVFGDQLLQPATATLHVRIESS